MIYAKKYNCPKNSWLEQNKKEEGICLESMVDIYKLDKENLKKEINEILEKKTKIDVLEFSGDAKRVTEQTKKVLNEKKILIKDGMLKHTCNDYYIKYDYLYKNEDKVFMFFVMFKDFKKAFKDYNTKNSFIPKFLYSKDIFVSNFPDINLITQILYLDIDTFNVTPITEDMFNISDVNKFNPLYVDLEQDEPDCYYSRKCKKCDYREYCNIPKLSIADLEFSQHCWRKLDPIIKSNESLDIDTITQTQIKTLNSSQLARYNAYMSDNGIFVDKDIIKDFLSKIKNGYISFDFETYSSILPFSNKYKNYSQIPFSFSLNIVDGKNQIKKSYDYIVDSGSDNFDSLIIELVDNMPTNLPIVVYYKTFEITRLKELQELYPEHNEIIQYWIDNIVDLYDVFANGGYYNIKFGNSVSLKNVYPALCNSKDYDLLSIQKGDDASVKYKEILNNKVEEIKKEKIQKEIMEYNKKDTLAQVEIIEKLKVIVK